VAFGDTDVLDDFNRADGALGDNWGTLYTHTKPVISGNQMYASASPRSAYWNPSELGPDCEAYMTNVTPSTAYLFIRLQQFVNPTGYMLWVMSEAGQIHRIANGTKTQLGAEFAMTYDAGDRVGIECIGDDIQAYEDDGGGWEELATRNDETYPDAGEIGVLLAAAGYWDNFGGGTVGGEEEPDEIVLNATIASTASFSTASAIPVMAPGVIASTASVPSMAVSPALGPTAITSTAVVNTPAGAPAVAPVLMTSTATVPDAILTTYWAWPPTITSTASVPSPVVSQVGVGGWWRTGDKRERQWEADDEEWLLL